VVADRIKHTARLLALDDGRLRVVLLEDLRAQTAAPIAGTHS
jgi:hypothetical protein